MKNYILIEFNSGIKQKRKIDLTEEKQKTNAFMTICNQMLELSIDNNEEINISLVVDSKEVRTACYK